MEMTCDKDSLLNTETLDLQSSILFTEFQVSTLVF